MRRLAPLAMAAGVYASACIEPRTPFCANGVECPVSKVCAPDGSGCIGQDQIDACAALGEDSNCSAASIGDGACISGFCQQTEWQATSILGGGTLATQIGISVESKAFLELYAPAGTAVDSQGSLYVGEVARVRRIDPSGVIVTVAGNGTQGFSGDGGLATSATLDTPRAVAVDGLGNLYFADTNNFRIRRVDAGTGVITTVAGNGSSGCTGDNGPATNATFRFPQGIAVDGAGQLYITDTTCHVIRLVDPAGIITTVAGSRPPGFSGDGGPATSAQMASPMAAAVDESGTIYIADTNNSRIRAVAPSGVIRTIAGLASPGFSGDGGPAALASLDHPTGVAVEHGSVYIADEGNARVRRIDATGTISTVAGIGASTAGIHEHVPATTERLNSPGGVALDRQGNLYIAVINRVRRVDPNGIIDTVAGNGTSASSGDGGAATSARFFSVDGLAIDPQGRVIATGQRDGWLRRVDLGTGIITTIGGTGIAGSTGEGGPATQAQMNPVGVAADQNGNLYFTDNNAVLRRIDAATGIITTIAGTGVAGFSGDGGPAIAAQLLRPMGIALDAAGDIYFLDSSRVRRIDPAGVITTIAGNGNDGFSGDGGVATSAKMSCSTAFFSCSLALDSSGNVYIADGHNHRVRKVDATTGIITTIAGTGVADFTGDGGLATAAALNAPRDVKLDAAGNLYIADYGNSRVRQISPSGIITTVVGAGTTGDWGPAITAELGPPATLAFDPGGNLFISGSGRIRRVDAATGTITTIAGAVDPEGMGPNTHASLVDPRALADGDGFTVVAGGSSGTAQVLYPDHLDTVAGRYPQSTATGTLARFRDASFGTISGVAFAPGVTIYLTESSANRVHAVTMVDPADKTTWTIAPILPSLAFANPTGLLFDPSAGQLYIADTDHHVIRAFDPASQTSSTLAGVPGQLGFGGDGADAAHALLFRPEAITRCPNGDLFIADTGNERIRRIDGSGTITTVLGDGSTSSSGEGAPASTFPVDTPLALACDHAGNLFVTSRTTVRMLLADQNGIVSGTNFVRTIYGRPPRDSFPSSVTRCLSGLTVVDAATVRVSDSCTGILLELRRNVVRP